MLRPIVEDAATHAGVIIYDTRIMTLNARIKAYKRGFGVFFGDYWAFIGKNAKIYTKECFAQNEALYLQIIVEFLQKHPL